MKRRDFLCKAPLAAALSGGVNPAFADQSEDLPETQWKPDPDLGTHWVVFQRLSADCTPSMSFLNDAHTDPEAWADEARRALRADFHYPHDTRPLDAETVERVDRVDFIRERVEYKATGGVRVALYLLIPKGLTKPAPGIVALHDHGGFYFWGKEKLVGLEPEHPALQAFKKRNYGGNDLADELARRGYVVVVPDMMHWGERAMYFEADPSRIKNRTLEVTEDDIGAFNARSWAHEEVIGRTALVCGTTWSGIITADDQRATDYLLSRPEVDADRVGCIGLSLGSVRSIFLGALHPKVRASVAVCWMAEYQQMTRNNVRWAIGFTKLVPGLYGKLDWPDLAGLHWPGALMTINGLKDELYPLQAAKDAVAKIARIYKKMNAPDRYEGVFFEGPHEFNEDMQARAFAWLDKQLH